MCKKEHGARIVPEQVPRMTILAFVDLVTVMRPRDVDSPINAILIAYISQLGLDVRFIQNGMSKVSSR